jgi:hypothetical protein
MKTTLFRSIYMFAKTELKLTDSDALYLAQFITANADGV